MAHRFLPAFAIAFAVFSAPAMAQDSATGFDSRWHPYLGCWTIAKDQLGQEPVILAPGTMVCVRPSGRFGVAITTAVDGKDVLDQTIIADGSAQPLSQGECKGTQTSEWSRDGERLFTRVSLDCAGRPARTVSGITTMVKGQWVDIQAIVVDNDHDLRVRRYRRSSDPYNGIPATTTSPLNVEDIIEANAKVQSPAVEAVLLEVGGRFTLNSRVLRQLADAKVSPNVIDLMVAQAYPDRFDIDSGVYPPVPVASGSSSTSQADLNATIITGGGVGYPYPLYDPFYSSYYYYSPFAYPYYWGAGYRYRYGYPYYRSYYNYYGAPGYPYYPGSIYTGGPSDPGSGYAPPGTPESRGGSGIATSRGYTRVRPAGSGGGGGESATPTGGGSVGGGSRNVGSTGSSGSSSSSSSSSSSGSSGSTGSSSGASSGGYSGGNRGGGGRTAQPR